jgi:hypothetical protein
MKRAFALFSLLASSSLTFAAMNVDSAHARRDDMRGVGKGASAKTRSAAPATGRTIAPADSHAADRKASAAAKAVKGPASQRKPVKTESHAGKPDKLSKAMGFSVDKPAAKAVRSDKGDTSNRKEPSGTKVQATAKNPTSKSAIKQSKATSSK